MCEDSNKCCKVYSGPLIIGPTGPQGIQGEIGPTGPQGITGPTGPQGQSIKPIYGSKYDDNGVPLTLQVNTPTTIVLSQTGALSNITGANQNTLTIAEDGVYKIDFSFVGSSNVDTELTISVAQNNTDITGAVIKKNVEASQEFQATGSVITVLNSNSEIALKISSSTEATITPESALNSYLNIILINQNSK